MSTVPRRHLVENYCSGLVVLLNFQVKSFAHTHLWAHMLLKAVSGSGEASEPTQSHHRSGLRSFLISWSNHDTRLSATPAMNIFQMLTIHSLQGGLRGLYPSWLGSENVTVSTHQATETSALSSRWEMLSFCMHPRQYNRNNMKPGSFHFSVTEVITSLISCSSVF